MYLARQVARSHVRFSLTILGPSTLGWGNVSAASRTMGTCNDVPLLVPLWHGFNIPFQTPKGRICLHPCRLCEGILSRPIYTPCIVPRHAQGEWSSWKKTRAWHHCHWKWLPMSVNAACDTLNQNQKNNNTGFKMIRNGFVQNLDKYVSQPCIMRRNMNWGVKSGFNALDHA